MAILMTTAAGALQAAGQGVTTQAVAAPPPRPNILLIMTDDQTLESMRVMDHVDRVIGDQGVTFTRNFVSYSLCCPSRATLMTGQYEHNHGVMTNEAPTGGFDRFDELHATNNLAVWLQDAGYYTTLIGKYLNGYKNTPPVPAGWSEWHAASPDTQRVYDWRMSNNGVLTTYGEDPADFKQDVFTEKAVGYIARRAPLPKPFFLWLSYTAPHDGTWGNAPLDYCTGVTAKPAPRHAGAFASEPLPMPPNFNEADVSDKPQEIRHLAPIGTSGLADIRTKYRCTLESLLSVDEGVQQVIDALRSVDELSNTVIMFTSDNGFFDGEHRIRPDKVHVYDESIRVPLMMRGPGIPRGATRGAMTVNADLAPTIVDIADATPGLVMDGRSLLPVINNPGIENGRELLIESEKWLKAPAFKAIRTKRYMYAEHSTGEKELYDLQNDPYELRSRHNDPAYALVKAQLATELQKLKNCSGAGCRLHRPDPKP
jgi:arylsulfatase A-like enzyme